MGRKKGSDYKDQIKRVTLGLFNSLTDVCLFTTFLSLQSFVVSRGNRGFVEAIDKAIHWTKITHANNLSRIIYRAKNRGYLEKKKDYLKITKLGRERLARILPKYEKERPWDGILYLITYDIPEDKKRDRDYLRDYLKKLGCGMLQYSVWLTPYNPKRLIVDHLKKRGLVGLVLVSELKEGSLIGGKNILKVIARVYKLDELNDEYEGFVTRSDKKELVGIHLIMSYLSILQRDPQPPFELLPPGWWGKVAHKIYKSELSTSRPRAK